MKSGILTFYKTKHPLRAFVFNYQLPIIHHLLFALCFLLYATF